MFSTLSGDWLLQTTFGVSDEVPPEIPQGLIYYLILVFALLVATTVSIPLAGALVRYRANHSPRAVQLDAYAEGGVAPRTGPIVPSYFHVFGRVYRLEGISGLYRGLMPSVLTLLAGGTILVITAGAEPLKYPGKYEPNDQGVLINFLSSLGGLVISLPLTILSYRSITTPYRLSYFDLLGSLRVLLTPTERRRPWILYLTPGLLAASSLSIFVILVVFVPMNHLLFPRSPKGGVIDLTYIGLWKFALYFFIFFLTVAVLAPLEVIVTRLAIQRNHSPIGQVDTVSQEVELYSQAEEVIGLRDESDPYLGLIDCTKRIINEEGWPTLYRAWWVVFLGVFGSSFA